MPQPAHHTCSMCWHVRPLCHHIRCGSGCTAQCGSMLHVPFVSFFLVQELKQLDREKRATTLPHLTRASITNIYANNTVLSLLELCFLLGLGRLECNHSRQRIESPHQGLKRRWQLATIILCSVYKGCCKHDIRHSWLRGASQPLG